MYGGKKMHHEHVSIVRSLYIAPFAYGHLIVVYSTDTVLLTSRTSIQGPLGLGQAPRVLILTSLASSTVDYRYRLARPAKKGEKKGVGQNRNIYRNHRPNFWVLRFTRASRQLANKPQQSRQPVRNWRGHGTIIRLWSCNIGHSANPLLRIKRQ